MNDTNEKKEKVYTLKNVKNDMDRIIKSRDKKKDKVKQLNTEIKADNTRLKELEVIYKKLYTESMQRKIADVWIKENKMSAEQISKYLELSKQLGDKIDTLEIADIVEAISLIEPKVDTYSNNNDHQEQT